MGRQQKRRAGWNARQTWAVLGLLAFCLALALPLYAEEGRASDVDAWAALKFGGLELRDARNGIVSRSVIEQGLREGTQRSARRSAELSKLAGLRALLSFLDRSDLLASSWRDESPITERGTCSLAVSPRKDPKLRPPPQRVLAAPEVRADFLPSPLLFCTTPGFVRVLNLRE